MEFSLKTKLVTGYGCLKKIGEIVQSFGVKKVLLCTDAFLLQTPAAHTIQRELGQHRTIHGCRLKCRPACIFSGSCHKKPREYTKYSLRFLFKLPKNLPAQFST